MSELEAQNTVTEKYKDKNMREVEKEDKTGEEKYNEEKGQKEENRV